jgi:hypothetical protein
MTTMNEMRKEYGLPFEDKPWLSIQSFIIITLSLRINKIIMKKALITVKTVFDLYLYFYYWYENSLIFSQTYPIYYIIIIIILNI